MTSISIIYVTVREDFSIKHNPRIHQFVPMLKCFQRQTFKDFEIILVDGLYEHRKDYPFPSDLHIKHVPHHPNHRMWLDMGYWAVASALNTGVIHSQGELLIFFTDCLVFDKHLLQQYWDWYEKGYFPLCGFRGIDYEPETPLSLVKKRWSWEMDTRLTTMGTEVMISCPPEWWYGLSSAPIDAILRVNGYDESFDGCKCLEDMDMGIRMGILYPKQFVLDKRMIVTNLSATPITKVKNGNFKHNYPLLVLNRDKRRAVANRDRLTEEEVKYVYERTLYEGELMKPEGPNPMNPDDPLFQFWVDHQPIFDLREERLELD